MEKQKGKESSADQKQQALNVARTNDESVVSKRSSARAGYFDDRFLPHFVRKPSKRAALINRGYYIRREAVMLAVRQFLKVHGRECQIVSLGAGFDTLFFVLAALDQHPKRCYEMDFDHVVKNKRTLIEGTDELMQLVGADARINAETNEIESERYALLCGDLCQVANVKARLTQHGLSYELPTLFLAECVFTYMPNGDSDKLIFWAASAPFPECWFVTYEQVRPYDAFGRTMRDNLKARGSDLLGIEGYPSVEAQQDRYVKLGFKSVGVRTMLDVYWDYLAPEERTRVEAMEEFDEHEEWLEKCSHYILAVSSTKAGADVPFRTLERSETRPPTFVAEWKDSLVQTSGRSVELKRWGHSACVTSDDRIVMFGGYGGGARHERLNSVVVMHNDVVTLPSVSGTGPSARVLHGACMLADDQLLVHGGRAGPGTPLDDAFVLNCRTMQWRKLTLPPGLPGCYRHSLTAAGEGAARLAIGFGGRTGWKHGEECGSLWMLSPDERTWRPIPFATDSNQPSARSSHAACWHRGALYIHGGLDADHRILSDMWRLEFDATFSVCRAEFVAETGVARFSHSAVAADDATLLLLGGHNGLLQNSIAVVDSTSGIVRGVVPTAEGWSRSRHVAVDNRIVSVGGGMLCFSFGSAFCGDELVVHTFPRRLTGVAAVIAEVASAVVEIPKVIVGNRVIQRVHNATAAQFREILLRREPVLFSGSDVPRWSRDDILAAVPPETLASIHVCESALLDFANKNFRFEVVPFAEMLSRIEEPGAHLYFRSLGANARKDPSNVAETFPNLAKQFLLPDFAREVVPLESVHSSCLRFSSQDIQMWTHYDINDNLLCGVRGRKRLVLFHPEEIRHLYPEGTASAVLDVETPNLAKFPRFAKAVKWEGILEEGDVLFIPAMWWHNVRTLTPCYGLNVFFRHLPEASYQTSDLYGNKDPLLAVAAEKAAKQAAAHLNSLPEEYRRFFARKLIMQMKSEML
jgi:tRNA wybutosine-synthesizing protein 4